MKAQVIWLHPLAPAKPAAGQACNGCGVCCTAEPCPVGVLLSRRTRGACVALVWNEPQQAYRCSVVDGHKTKLPPALARAWRRLALRWIAAGAGCDCNLQPGPG